MEDEDLQKQIKELNERISELEDQISKIVRPVQDMQRTATKYLRLVDMALKHGRISPDMLVPEIKDPISKDIICVLVEKGHLNISQLTEGLRMRRGSASRRVVREKIKALEDQNLVTKNTEKKVSTYYISEKVVRKWSEVLGISL